MPYKMFYLESMRISLEKIRQDVADIGKRIDQLMEAEKGAGGYGVEKVEVDDYDANS